MKHARHKRNAMLLAGVLAVLGITAGTVGTRITAHSDTAQGVARTATPSTAVYPMTLTDEAGNKVTLAHAPKRIASVTEGTDEILADLVPLKDIVLVTKYGKIADQSFVAARLKNIPAINTATAEAIIARHPDLVFLASYTTPGVVNQIRQAGIPVYELTDFNSIPEIEQNILNVGQAVGESGKAQQLVASMKTRIAEIQKAVQGAGKAKKVTVLDYSSDGYVAGSGTTMNDIIQDAGATNAAKGIKGWQTISDEQLVALNPNVIIFSHADAKFAESVIRNPKFQTVSAVRNHDIHLLKDADLSTVSQYIVNAVGDLAQSLNPKIKLPK